MRAWRKIAPATVVAIGIAFAALPGFAQTRTNYPESVKELIALAQAQPGKILFGSAGAGTATHMNGVRFRLAAGIKAMQIVPPAASTLGRKASMDFTAM